MIAVKLTEVITEIERFKGYLDEDMILRIKIAISRLPTIDAVQVVRCKECKFNYANQIPGDDDTCQLCVELPISKEFFCAYGERMDEEEL